MKVLRYAHYLTSDQNSKVFSYHDFCGQCRREIKNAYESPIYPEQVDDPYSLDRNLAYMHVAFCPWCGVSIDADGWRNRPLQNERKPDHFRDPGWHSGDSGDTHEFKGFLPGGHWLGVSGGDKLCWCEPDVTPNSDGCVISHRNIEKNKLTTSKKRSSGKGPASVSPRRKTRRK